MAPHKQFSTASAPSGIDPDLRAHIKFLGLNSVEDYQRWCDQNGFSRRTQKHWRRRLKERATATRTVADERLARRKIEVRRPKRVIEQIFDGNVAESDLTQPHLAAIYRAYQSTLDGRCAKFAV